MKLTKELIFSKLNDISASKIVDMKASLVSNILVTESCSCDETDDYEDCEACENEDCDLEECLDVFPVEGKPDLYEYTELDEETLLERKVVIRVTSRGQRIKRIKCPKGRVVKIVNGRKVCVTPSGRARLVKKVAVRKAVRTKNARGAGYKKRTNFRRQRALRRRKQMGIKNNQVAG
jgi:hypothetical protein